MVAICRLFSLVISVFVGLCVFFGGGCWQMAVAASACLVCAYVLGYLDYQMGVSNERD